MESMEKIAANEKGEMLSGLKLEIFLNDFIFYHLWYGATK